MFQPGSILAVKIRSNSFSFTCFDEKDQETGLRIWPETAEVHIRSEKNRDRVLMKKAL
jgi:hypothetical protein